MQAAEKCGAVVEAVWCHRNVAPRGEREYLAQFRYSTHLGRARLQVIDRARFQQMLELRERSGVFACGHRDAAPGAHLRQRGVVFRRPHRLFQPAQVERPQFLRHRQRFLRGPRAVHVEHDVHVGAGSLARGPGGREFDLVQLDMAKALP